MDRTPYTSIFTAQSLPPWNCPTCHKGLLQIKENTFNRDDTFVSKAKRNNADWHPENTSYVYSCLLLCNNPNCFELVASCGKGFILFIPTGPDTHEFQDFFEPLYFTPALRIFPIPRITPEAVKVEILASFESFFSNPGSAGNHVRVALESILTAMRIKRYVNRKGRRVFIVTRPY